MAIAETERQGNVFYGTNFSPTFSDPVSHERISFPAQSGPEEAFSINSALSCCYAYPGVGVPKAAAVHIISPALSTSDRGKTNINTTAAMRWTLGDAIWAAARVLYREGKARERDAARQARAEEARDRERERAERRQEVTLKDAVFAVMEEGVRRAGGDGAYDYSHRTLMYQVRPLVQELPVRGGRDLTQEYFRKLTDQYQRDDGPLKGLYYEPRGTLYEPHSERRLELGTREVYQYEFPEYQFDKALYVEKQGLWPVLEDSGLGKRYDMGIIAGAGEPVEAWRALFARAEKGNYKLFVLHDADPGGYSIAMTIRAETDRMPGYHVDVVDMGLTVPDALAMGLETETFTRKKALAKKLVLNDEEKEWFTGRYVGKRAGRDTWIATRCELNAMTSPQLVEFIERKQEEHGATGKVVPPADYIQGRAEALADTEVRQWISRYIERLLDIDVDSLAQEFTPQLYEEIKDKLTADLVSDQLSQNRQLPWAGVVRSWVSGAVNRSSGEMGPRVREVLQHTIEQKLQDLEEEEE